MLRLDAPLHHHRRDYSSESFPKESGRIEVLVKSLDGICIENESNCRPSLPWVTATVAFSGSASDMEVGSSSVCGITGQLMVQSEPVIISCPDMMSKSPKLCAQWMEEKRNGTTQPHLTMQFSNVGKDVPTKSLQEGNRGATFVKQGLESSRTSSTVSETTASSSLHNDTLEDPNEEEDYNSRSGVWSDSGDTMPEIIEMYVRLRHHEDGVETALWDGVAFLVVYGHEDDSGTHLLELPIRKAAAERRIGSRVGSTISNDSSSSSRRSSRMRLSGDAKLTVQVKVTPCRPTPSITVASSIVASGSPLCPEVVLSQSAIEDQLKPLLEKLRQSEEFAKKLCENQKRAMDVKVPGLSPDEPLPRPPPSADSSCYVPILSEWMSFFTRLASMTARCEMAHDGDSVNRDENSTIATRDSIKMFPKACM
eukprot:scaffold15076_cov155-Amphora_coffeaeformis.AAC.1